MASEQRTRDDERIRRATRTLVFGSLAATVAFGGLAAAATHHESAPAVQSQTEEQSNPSVSAPQQSFAPPVARSNGS